MDENQPPLEEKDSSAPSKGSHLLSSADILDDDDDDEYSPGANGTDAEEDDDDQDEQDNDSATQSSSSTNDGRKKVVLSSLDAKVCGFLTKQGGRRKSWCRRWMVLQNSKIYYFRAQSPSSKNAGIIPLKSSTFIRTSPLTFSIQTPSRTFLLRAESPKEIEMWAEEIIKKTGQKNPEAELNKTRRITSTKQLAKSFGASDFQLTWDWISKSVSVRDGFRVTIAAIKHFLEYDTYASLMDSTLSVPNIKFYDEWKTLFHALQLSTTNLLEESNLEKLANELAARLPISMIPKSSPLFMFVCDMMIYLLQTHTQGKSIPLLTHPSQYPLLSEALSSPKRRTCLVSQRFGRITNCLISPDSRFAFVAGSLPGDENENPNQYFPISKVDLWSGSLLGTYTGQHTSRVTSLKYTVDEKYIISGSIDKTIVVWDIATFDQVMTFNCKMGKNRERKKVGNLLKPVSHIAVDPNGRFIYVSSDECQKDSTQVTCWDLSNGECVKQLNAKAGKVTSLIVDPNSRNIYAGCYSFALKIAKVVEWIPDAKQNFNPNQVIPLEKVSSSSNSSSNRAPIIKMCIIGTRRLFLTDGTACDIVDFGKIEPPQTITHIPTNYHFPESKSEITTIDVFPPKPGEPISRMVAFNSKGYAVMCDIETLDFFGVLDPGIYLRTVSAQSCDNGGVIFVGSSRSNAIPIWIAPPSAFLKRSGETLKLYGKKPKSSLDPSKSLPSTDSKNTPSSSSSTSPQFSVKTSGGAVRKPQFHPDSKYVLTQQDSSSSISIWDSLQGTLIAVEKHWVEPLLGAGYSFCGKFIFAIFPTTIKFFPFSESGMESTPSGELNLNLKKSNLVHALATPKYLVCVDSTDKVYFFPVGNNLYSSSQKNPKPTTTFKAPNFSGHVCKENTYIYSTCQPNSLTCYLLGGKKPKKIDTINGAKLTFTPTGKIRYSIINGFVFISSFLKGKSWGYLWKPGNTKACSLQIPLSSQILVLDSHDKYLIALSRKSLSIYSVDFGVVSKSSSSQSCLDRSSSIGIDQEGVSLSISPSTTLDDPGEHPLSGFVISVGFQNGKVSFLRVPTSKS